MDNMKGIVVGLAFTAMLALTLVAGGGQAYAGGGKPTQDGNSQGQTTRPSGGGLNQTFGITWE